MMLGSILQAPVNMWVKDCGLPHWSMWHSEPWESPGKGHFSPDEVPPPPSLGI